MYSIFYNCSHLYLFNIPIYWMINNSGRYSLKYKSILMNVYINAYTKNTFLFCLLFGFFFFLLVCTLCIFFTSTRFSLWNCERSLLLLFVCLTRIGSWKSGRKELGYNHTYEHTLLFCLCYVKPMLSSYMLLIMFEHKFCLVVSF